MKYLKYILLSLLPLAVFAQTTPINNPTLTGIVTINSTPSVTSNMTYVDSSNRLQLLTLGSGLLLSGGVLNTTGGGGGGGGISAVSGTTNQVIAVTTNNAVTLSTPQNIDTGAAVQFGSLGIGIAPSVSIPINFQPTVTDNAGGGKAVRISPTITQTQTGDTIYDTILGGIINANSFTGGSISELTLGSPTVSGSFSTGYQLYLAGLNSGTFSTKYGIFQNGTETNQLNNLKLTPSGGGGITFADGSVQYTAATGGGGGGGSVTAVSTGNLTPLFVTNVTNYTTTPNITFTQSPVGGYTIYGNSVGLTGYPAFNSISSYLDSFSSTQGSVLYRGSSSWSALNPVSSGYVLQSGGSGANPAWVNPASYFVTSLTGTTNRVSVSASTGSITLSGPQDIGTTSSPQFFSIGLGSGAGPLAGAVSILGNYYGQSLFSTSPFGIADTPTLVAAGNNESFTGINITPVLNTASYSSLTYYGINLGTPSGGSSSVSTAYQIYIGSAPSATTKYGLYQSGSDVNQLNNLKLTPSGGGGITFADGTTQYTAGGGGGGGVSSVGLSMPSGFTVTNSPITTSGSLTVTTSLSGIIKGTGSGLTIGTAGVDYTSPSGSENLTNKSISSSTGSFSNLSSTSSTSIATATNSTLGVGINAQPGVNLYIGGTVAATSYPFGLSVSPTLILGANSGQVWGQNVAPTINLNSRTSNQYKGIQINTATLSGSGSLSNSYQLMIDAAPNTGSTNTYGIYQNGTDTNVFNGVVIMAHYTVATLPSASSNQYGECFVSDSNAPNGTGYGTTVVGGGSYIRKVFSDGYNWILE